MTTNAKTAPNHGSSAPRHLVVVSVVLLAALGVVGASAISTSSARFASSTTSQGRLASAEIVLDLESSSLVEAELPLSDTLLAPDQPVSVCADVTLTGAVNASTHLFAEIVDGSGLERYTDVRILATAGGCDDFPEVVWSSFGPPDRSGLGLASSETVYEGPLDELVRSETGDQTAGIALDELLNPGEGVAVVIDLWLAEDTGNSAQGLWVDVEFWLEATA